MGLIYLFMNVKSSEDNKAYKEIEMIIARENKLKSENRPLKNKDTWISKLLS